MKWYRRLRWKLFLSHTLVGVISVVVLIMTIYFLTNVGFLQDAEAPAPLTAADPTQTDSIFVAIQREFFHSTTRDALIVASFAAVEAAIIVSISISSRIVGPLQALSQVTRRLAHGAYYERTEIPSDDEVAELSRSINQLAETLEQTEQRRMALIGDITHEIRTPLATIGGYMEGLLDGVVKPDQHTFKLVRNETQRLQRLIDDLQLLSRAEAGQLPIVCTRLKLKPMLQDTITRHQPQFEAQQITLELSIPEPLPFVLADPDRVDQVLVNLLSNARRYTPTGGSVTVRVFPAEEVVVFCVEDTGVGIAAEHLPHLFERFYRVDKSRARASGGSGIGLTIARHLVHRQGGDIWAMSKGVGTGTRFYFTLPREPEVLFTPGTQVPVAASPQSSQAHQPSISS